MKKAIILTMLVFGSLINAQGYCNVNQQSYVKKFLNCSKYIYNSDSKISAILGWSSRKCIYQEFSGAEEISCSFKVMDLQDIAKSMKEENYNYVNGLSSLKGAEKYLSNPEVCKCSFKKQAQSF